MKKRPFLLLEILIGLSLLLIVAIPLLQKPIWACRAEIRALEEIEGERIADWTFSEIEEKLFQHEIPWEKLPKPGEKKGPFPLPPFQMRLPDMKGKMVRRAFSLYCDEKTQKMRQDEALYRLLLVEIEFTPPLYKKKQGEKNRYQYRIIVRKLPPGIME